VEVPFTKARPPALKKSRNEATLECP